MHKNKKVTGTVMGMPAGVGFGTLVSLIITLAGAALVSYLITTGKIGEETIGFSAMIILAVAATLGAWCAVNVVKRLRLQACMMTAVSYYLTLLALTALFFGGRYQGMGLSALIIIIGSGLIAFIPTKSGHIFKQRKRAYR